MKEGFFIGLFVCVYIATCVSLFFIEKIPAYGKEVGFQIVKKEELRIRKDEILSEKEEVEFLFYKQDENVVVGHPVTKSEYNSYEIGQQYTYFEPTLLWKIIAVICFLIFAIFCAANGVDILS